MKSHWSEGESWGTILLILASYSCVVGMWLTVAGHDIASPGRPFLRLGAAGLFLLRRAGKRERGRWAYLSPEVLRWAPLMVMAVLVYGDLVLGLPLTFLRATAIGTGMGLFELYHGRLPEGGSQRTGDRQPWRTFGATNNV